MRILLCVLVALCVAIATSSELRSQARATLENGRSRGRVSSATNFRLIEKQILDRILSKDVYDHRIRPAGVNESSTKGSTEVAVNVYLRSINDIDDYKMEFSATITFREEWNDERLTFDDMRGGVRYLTLTDPRRVWMPDTFFRNEKTGHMHSILVNNVYVRIYPQGQVLFSIRISLTLSCPMNLKLYPMDRQICSLRIASYGYTTDDITLLWKKSNPVQITPNMSLPRFTIEKYASRYCNVVTNTGEYSCLSVELVFKRQFSYYLITIYVPGCMLVIVSWVSFWLDPHAVPARVALGVTTLLTMSTQTASINSALPPVAYTKAIDVWQEVCVIFVFSALLEYALVNYALRTDRSYWNRRLLTYMRSGNVYDDHDYHNDHDYQPDHELVPKRLQQRRAGPAGVAQSGKLDERGAFQMECSRLRRSSNLLFSTGLVQEDECEWEPGSPASSPSCGCWPGLCWEGRRSDMFRPLSSMQRAKRIDVFARFLFPMVFAVFSISYWSNYILMARNEAARTLI